MLFSMAYETVSVRMNRSDPNIRWGVTFRKQGNDLVVNNVSVFCFKLEENWNQSILYWRILDYHLPILNINFILIQVERESLSEKAGIKNGDIVQTVRFIFSPRKKTIKIQILGRSAQGMDGFDANRICDNSQYEVTLTLQRYEITLSKCIFWKKVPKLICHTKWTKIGRERVLFLNYFSRLREFDAWVSLNLPDRL